MGGGGGLLVRITMSFKDVLGTTITLWFQTPNSVLHYIIKRLSTSFKVNYVERTFSLSTPYSLLGSTKFDTFNNKV